MSPSGRNSDSNVRTRRYGSKDPIFTMIRSYFGVHRSGMISATGLSVWRRVTAHRQGEKRGARTSTVPNTDNSRRARTSLSGRCDPQWEQRRRWRQYSFVCAWTRWSCNPARVRSPSASVSPTVAAEHSAVLLPRALTSCVQTEPSLPVNSTMTRHFIPFPRPAVFGLTHTTPQVWDGLVVPSETAQTAPTQRDCHLQSIAEHGCAAWHKASGYTKRACAEAAIGRFKQVIGDGLRSRTDERRATEVDVAVHALNRMLELGRPNSVRIA